MIYNSGNITGYLKNGRWLNKGLREYAVSKKTSEAATC